MKRYRTKPEYVEAQQWHKGDEPLSGMEPMKREDPDALFIRTPQGWRRVHDGNWVVVNQYRQHDLFSATDFEQLYERAE